MREWQSVTVAWRSSSSNAMGLPTSTLRPTTTARAPLQRDAGLVEQPHHAERRARPQARLPRHEPALVHRVEAVDVLRRSAVAR